MEKKTLKTVNLSNALKANEAKDGTNTIEEKSESLGAYILLTSLASVGGGLVFWIIILRILQIICTLSRESGNGERIRKFNCKQN